MRRAGDRVVPDIAEEQQAQVLRLGQGDGVVAGERVRRLRRGEVAEVEAVEVADVVAVGEQRRRPLWP